MAKIKLTKTELKAQRDALKRFSRYLPTLQLKKQQLQLELRHVMEHLQGMRRDEGKLRDQIGQWIELLDDEGTAAIGKALTVKEWQTGYRNIAGVEGPTFVGIEFAVDDIDLFATPVWYDDVGDTVRMLVELVLRQRLLEQQMAALEAELRTTTQRVNLFEKVKIPEAEDNIRRIQIYLGDEQTSAVGRAKIAKQKARALEEHIA